MSWILIVTLVAALAGGGGTVYASNRALPGDVLYPVKSTVEDLRLVVSDQDQHVGLYRRYAGTRVQELERLIRSQRVDEVPVALERFERHMQGAMAALDEVSGDDPEQAERLALELRQDLAFYRAELNRLVESTPERARPVVERAAVDLSEGQTQLNALFPGDPDDRQTVTDDDRDHDDDEDEDAEVEGVVEAIDHGALTLTVAGMTFRADADTKIEHVGAFDQIQGGDRVKVEYRTSDNYAFEIEVKETDQDDDEDAEVEGVVEAIDQGALTLTVAGMTFWADAGTEIEHVGAFDQIQVGDRVKVEYSTSDNYAFEIEAKETDQDDGTDASDPGDDDDRDRDDDDHRDHDDDDDDDDRDHDDDDDDRDHDDDDRDRDDDDDRDHDDDDDDDDRDGSDDDDDDDDDDKDD